MNFRANIAWNVYLNNRIIDTVFYTPDCDAFYVRDSLINHDCYDARIIVRKVN